MKVGLNAMLNASFPFRYMEDESTLLFGEMKN